MALVNSSVARDVALRALARAGAPEPNARIQSEILIEAELRGRASHGLLRLKRIIERIRAGVADPVTTGKHEWRSRAYLEVDGCHGLGPVVAADALRQLNHRVAETGIAIATIQNNNHLGMLAWYVEPYAAAGKIAIVLSTSEALVHPWGGRKALIGTNPIAIGVPAKPSPFVLDMATSKVSMGQIYHYAIKSQAIPLGWALDENGDPTTDPEAAKRGAIAPFGDAKGYALGLAFEVLVASLTDSALGAGVRGTLDSHSFCNKGDVLIVIDYGCAEPMVSRISEYLDVIRKSPPAQSGRSVGVPGDRARSSVTEALENGIEITDELWEQVSALAK